MVQDKEGNLFENKRKKDRRRQDIPVEVDRRKGSRREECIKKQNSQA